MSLFKKPIQTISIKYLIHKPNQNSHSFNIRIPKSHMNNFRHNLQRINFNLQLLQFLNDTPTNITKRHKQISDIIRKIHIRTQFLPMYQNK